MFLITVTGKTSLFISHSVQYVFDLQINCTNIYHSIIVQGLWKRMQHMISFSSCFSIDKDSLYVYAYSTKWLTVEISPPKSPRTFSPAEIPPAIFPQPKISLPFSPKFENMVLIPSMHNLIVNHILWIIYCQRTVFKKKKNLSNIASDQIWTPDLLAYV